MDTKSKVAAIVGTIMSIITGLAGASNYNAGTLTDTLPAILISALGLTGIVPIVLSVWWTYKTKGKETGRNMLFTELEKLLKDKANASIVTKSDQIDVPLLNDDGQYAIKTQQQRDIEALNHLATRASYYTVDPELREKMVDLCAQLHAAFFKVHHGSKGVTETDVTAKDELKKPV